jgi:hypothetical protein
MGVLELGLPLVGGWRQGRWHTYCRIGSTDAGASSSSPPYPTSTLVVEMAMSTRNLSTRRVLPDKEVGVESYFYPRVHKWATSCTHRVSGCGCGYILPIPAYPRVKYTHLQYVINEQSCTLLVKDDLIYITNKEVHALLDY